MHHPKHPEPKLIVEKNLLSQILYSLGKFRILQLFYRQTMIGLDKKVKSCDIALRLLSQHVSFFQNHVPLLYVFHFSLILLWFLVHKKHIAELNQNLKELQLQLLYFTSMYASTHFVRFTKKGELFNP